MPIGTPSAISGIVYASAMGPVTSVAYASSVSSNEFGGSGAWLIEEQTLTVDYWRFPRVAPSGLNLSLSAASFPLHVAWTDWWVRVQGTYSRSKSYDIYASATETRMQTFGYQADSTDQEGVTYNGTSTGTSLPASALGVNGTVFTSRPYYSRRLWIEGRDTEVMQTTLSPVHNMYMGGTMGDFASLDDIFQDKYWACSEITYEGLTPSHPNNQWALGMRTPMPGAHISSNYDPDEDFVKTKVPQILDLVADKIKQGTLGSYTSNSTEMIPSYSKARHDYTTIVG